MNLIKKSTWLSSYKIIFWNIVIFLVLFVAVDLFYTKIVSKKTREQAYRVQSNYYHHGFVENYSGMSVWGEKKYYICTDTNGFKAKCGEPSLKKFDIAFIGDSFTEAVGMEYQQSFVGKFAENYPLPVANLAVSSYSPILYLKKVEYLLNKGIQFNHLVVFVDISDIQDEIIYAQIMRDSSPNFKKMKFSFRDFIVNNFKLTTLLYLTLKYSLPTKDPFEPRINLEKSAWTYNPHSSGYGDMGIENAIDLATDNMNALYDLLQKNNIKMSVGVYPWPDQIYNDTLVNNKQAILWKKFCENKCEMFIDAFPIFEKLRKDLGKDGVYRKFYIAGDVHFNEDGNHLIYEVVKNYFMQRPQDSL